jgi:hypothetical protein
MERIALYSAGFTHQGLDHGTAKTDFARAQDCTRHPSDERCSEVFPPSADQLKCAIFLLEK